MIVTVPVRSSSTSFRAVFVERVQPEAVRPNSESFARVIASSRLSTTTIGRTGPKVSSRITRIPWLTSTRTVGGNQ